METNTTIKITKDMALKDIRKIAKSLVPRKAKTMRYQIDGGKYVYDKATNLDVLHELDALAEFSAAALAKVKKDESAFGNALALKVSATGKGKENPGERAARLGTGFMKLVDDLLRAGQDTVNSATEKVLSQFKDKEAKSVRRIVSNRPYHLRKRGEKGAADLHWLPAIPQSGVMAYIDELYADPKQTMTFKEIVFEVMEKFPKTSTGEARDFEAQARIVRNRARILRKAGKPVHYQKTVVTHPKPAKAKKGAKKAPTKKKAKGSSPRGMIKA